MKIHEYQAKDLLKKYGIRVPRGIVAFSPAEARAAFERLAAPAVMIKAQILTGGRGKSGGILKAGSAAETEAAAAKLIGSAIKTFQTGTRAEIVKSVLIEERAAFENELYLAVTIDRSAGLPAVVFAESGGMDIEEAARTRPDSIRRIPFKPDPIPDAAFFAGRLMAAGGRGETETALAETAARLAALFIEHDCQLAEINPLARAGSSLLALDGKIIFDDNAAFRHPEHEPLRDPAEDDPKEKRAKKQGLSYISLEGNIGCLVNGAGLAMATMDIIKQAGGEPANFLDVGGGANKEQVEEGFRIILEDPNVEAVLVNIFGGIMKCDIIAQALIDAASAMRIRVPVIVRLEGTRVAEGRELLARSQIALHSAASMEEAAHAAVRLARKNASVSR